jgi:hypothetical protein
MSRGHHLLGAAPEGSHHLVDDQVQATRRRAALEKWLDRHDLTPMEAARAAGLVNANALYNFLKGRTKSLSQQTLERLNAAVPGSSLHDLTGVRERAAVHARRVAVWAIARAGVFEPKLPSWRHDDVLLPLDEKLLDDGACAVLVGRPGAEEIYPEGSILGVVPFDRYKEELHTGRRVILRRARGARTETTVRELELRDSDAWLWLRSTDPRHQVPVQCPWPYENQTWTDHHDEFVVAAVVVGAWIPE